MVASGCGKSTQVGGTGDAASRVYVPPGQYDEFYMFTSGGFSGQLSVYGLPSGRLLRVIPVFSQDPEKAYGYSEQSKPMLMTSYGFLPWDDAHHPSLSKTDGMNDGRWVFINGNNTPRVARIDLAEMNTKEIIEIPNARRQPCLAVRHPGHRVCGIRDAIQRPDAAAGRADRELQGELRRADQLRGGGSQDRRRCRWHSRSTCRASTTTWRGRARARRTAGPSSPSYNTEQANSLMERNASQNDKDFIAAVNWKQA